MKKWKHGEVYELQIKNGRWNDIFMNYYDIFRIYFIDLESKSGSSISNHFKVELIQNEFRYEKKKGVKG